MKSSNLWTRGQRPSRLLGVLAAAAMWSAANAAHAEPMGAALSSEIITPAGWETSRTAEECDPVDLGTSREIVTPQGWAPRERHEKPTWSGCVCSDLVVPAEWREPVVASAKSR